MSDAYREFVARKSQLDSDGGFAPVFMPRFLFDFQAALVEWAVRKGRAALFADCGLGKTPMALTWAQNVVQHTNGRVLILTPLAVGAQFVTEAEKFGIEVHRTTDVGGPGIYIANYQRLHRFNASDFAGVVCDESSILKNFDGSTRAAITEFMRERPYRLLTTATATPNDVTELGTSSEALGQLGHMDMLNRFFKNDQNTSDVGRKWTNHGGGGPQWRFKGHAEQPFWRWVCSWARSLRKPSDLGFSDERFVLPPLNEREHIVGATKPRDGMLFALPAQGLTEQRQERRHTVAERCAKAASLVVGTRQPAIMWAHTNAEGDLMESLVPDSVQVSGADSDDEKEEKFATFIAGEKRVLVIKPAIGCFGLNLQNCAHMTVFAGYSFEQYYQGVRRCWRFGQTRSVTVDHVVSDGEGEVLAARRRKALNADRLFESIVEHMRTELQLGRGTYGDKPEELPQWLCSISA